jgi:hypothetical protein
VSTSRPDNAVDVLREIWRATGQEAGDVDEACGPQRECKKLSAIGFDAMAGPDGDLRSAWRATLEREGKVTPGATSVRDLVLGPAEAGR